MSKTGMLLSAAIVVAAAGAANADVITEWGDTYNDVARLTGGAPCPISRAVPMFTLAMYDAVNSIDKANNVATSFKPYQNGLPVPSPTASREASAATAAYTVLSALHASSPSSLAVIQQRYDEQLAAIPNGQSKTDGINFGMTVANSLLAKRLNDGYDGDDSYTVHTGAGYWRETPDTPGVSPFTPHWGNVKPWGIQSGAQFRPTRLTDYGTMEAFMASPEYAANVEGARLLGARDSATRTDDQTEAAWFWANDRDGTSKPSGQLLDITRNVSNDKGLSLSENARVYGLVGLALGDACIAAWDAKYNTDFDLWRPIDAIRESDDDGNPNTIPDEDWLPLNDFTPPFPTYVSGHGTFAAAHAGVMAALFGDNTTFTIDSDEFKVNPNLPYDPNHTRTYNSFSEAAWENAQARVWLGVHFDIDAIDANVLGYAVADYIMANYLPSPGAASLFGLGLIAAGRRRG